MTYEVKIEKNKIYSFIRDKWLELTPEEQVRQGFVCHLMNHYGYKLEQMSEELTVSNASRGQGKARADIVIWKSKEDKLASKNAFIVIECKAENVRIRKEDYYQGCNYARWAGAKFFVTSNPPFGSQVRDDVKITTEDLQDQEAIKQYINKYGDKYKDCLLTEDDVGKAINKRFDIGSKLTEVLFIERCLNLLKKGGRLGIVLPDGVLNGANLQKCRDFVEGKAKILMITSIPQDVFVAAGATVKPSLLFFKKFTEEEELLYNQIKDEATKEVNTKFATQEEDAQQLPTKEKKAKLKEIAEQKASKIKSLIKERFNYEIPIANVQKAGIDTLGNECENQLIEVLQEFKKYQSNHKMWNTPNKKIYKYSFDATKIKREEVA